MAQFQFFGEKEAYITALGLYELRLIKNLTLLQAFPMRKRERAAR
jgi:hypothetical protein